MRHKIFFISLALLAALSCSKFTDLDPTRFYGQNVVWNGDEATLDQYVFGLYAAIRDKAELYNSNMNSFTDAYSDIVKASGWDQYGQGYNLAMLQETAFTSANAGAFENWSDSYTRIKRDNQFLRDAVTFKDKYDPKFLKVRVAEARFLKAFSYYYLIRVYGGVVIRGENVDGPEENDAPRVSEADSWSYVIGNLKTAAEDLPETWNDANYGRATKAAAYGLLSRVALYKACALKNSGAPADSVSAAYRMVIDYADEVIARESTGTVALASSYADVFKSQKNKENLLTVSFFGNDVAKGLSDRSDVFFRPVGDSQFHGGAPVYGTFGPTSELVDSYEMADGSAFDWAVSGTDPYTGREPRFYATIIYNGMTWEGREIRTYDLKGYDNADPLDPDSHYPYDHISEFKYMGNAGSTVTGYYMRKWITEGDKDWEVNGSSHFWIALRYAEVLLNKAEAQAQNGDIPNALVTLQRVRDRVSLPAMSASDIDGFMTLLEHERMVELAGEGFRFWDLRRWRRAVDVLSGTQMHGCWITRAADGTYSYKQVVVDDNLPRVFFERYYAFAIPEGERSTNAGLGGENNPGW
ncbi:MAG: RagB/SusD family nutrient uptake outer membrane protein [Bacteroidales bacterium]|nr:RagB/SusD family nutrient uptake outer membrane protein [Bacteroidales bacterium]